ncbi:uncharacterized protein AB9W97_013591 isoform 2-T2 [Spinachia spinachia]
MSSPTVNLDTYSLSLLTAKEDILNLRSSTNWAIFTYDGITNKLKLADSGAGGVAELAGKFHISKAQYGLCKVECVETGRTRIAMIIWVGQNVEDFRRTECASHIPAIKSFFKEAHAFITAEKVEDVTEEKMRLELSKAQAQAPTQLVRKSCRSADKEELVGTNYRKTNAAMEMRRINRDSFWARAEREEEERKEEEKRRASEERRRLERERVSKERRAAEERDRKMNEKLEMIEEQRRKQAEQEEELLRKEKSKWEQQQREHVEAMRARLSRSESIEKAAEAAALVSQRSMNPREFFRQLSSSSSQSPTSPGSSRSGKPFRRYQRSLTDTAFIFTKAEESTSSSPYSSPRVSPFCLPPPSSIYHAMSPPTSPITSPQRSTALVSPPTSPLRPASAAPSVPQTNKRDQVFVQPKPPSPAEPSAPPASPSLLASLYPSLAKNDPCQLDPAALPPSPPNTPTQSEPSTFCFQPGGGPQAPTAHLPGRPQPNTDSNIVTLVHAENFSDDGYLVNAVLVEEDEEEDVEEHEGDQIKMQPKPCAVTTEPDQKEENEREEEDKEGEEEGLEQEAERSALEDTVEVVQEEEGTKDEENDQSEDSQTPSEPAELSKKEEDSTVPDAEPICQEIRHEPVIPSTNGITNGEQTRSLSPSDTELSSPELAGRYDPHSTAEGGDQNEEEEEEEPVISENGQEVLAKQQMCVRALYDYQAEDESEISFEPGDIIKDVETVDTAWWRGWSKDGCQGLFPANYVETI